MKKILIGVGAVIVVLLIAFYAFRGAIVLRMMNRVMAANFLTNLVMELEDGLHAGLCGAGSPLPDPNRSGPCTAIIAGDRLFIVDAGSGSSRVMTRMRIPQADIEAILLTHLHSDHIDGLGEMQLQRWAGGAAKEPIPVHGPEGVQDVVDGINQAYLHSRRYRVAHHGPEIVPPEGAGGVAHPFVTPAMGEGLVLVNDGGLKITAFRVEHEPVEPAVGYRFDYKGRSIVVSGDTKKSANLERFSKDVDLLIHEALATHLVERMTQAAETANRPNLAKITRDITDYHTTPVEAAEVARDAGAQHLLFNHIVPPLLLGPMEDLFVQGVSDAYDGPFTVGTDGTFVRLPAGSDAIHVSNAMAR